MRPAAPKLPAVLPQWDEKLAGDAICGRHLRGVDFSGKCVEELVLRKCLLENCRLTGAVLEKCDWEDVKLVRCELSGADLSDSSWHRCVAEDCRMLGVSFYGASLRDTDWRACRATDADFRQTRWKKAALSHCNLSGARFGSVSCKILSRERAIFHE